MPSSLDSSCTKTPHCNYIETANRQMAMDIKINGRLLPQDNPGALFFRKAISESLLWPSLMFSVVDTRKPRLATIELALMCKLVNALLPQLSHVLVEHLERLNIIIEYWTPATNCYMDRMNRHFQYLLASLALHLEYSYPFVFSFYGKHLVRLNIENLLRVHSYLSALGCAEEKGPPLAEMVLLRLQRSILHEFNSLNIMKECDFSSHRLRQCKDSWLKHDFTYRSIKCMVFSPSMLSDLHNELSPAPEAPI